MRILTTIIALILLMCSGIIAQVHYPVSSTSRYHTHQTVKDSLQAQRLRTLEKEFYTQTHRDHTDSISLSFDIHFINNSTLHTTDFKKDVELQLAALNACFMPDSSIINTLPVDTLLRNSIGQANIHFNAQHSMAPFAWQHWDNIKNTASHNANNRNPNAITIWITDTPDSIGSYVSLPEGNPRLDGIVLDVDYFASGTAPYDKGKTLCFLMGEYFGLKPLNGGVGNCQDDGVKDTPIHPFPITRCIPYEFPSSCDQQRIMPYNIMSYAPDDCRNIFTKGQVARMHYFIKNAHSLSHKARLQ